MRMRSIVLALLLSTQFACSHVTAEQHIDSTDKSRIVAPGRSATVVLVATDAETGESRAGAEINTISHSASIRKTSTTASTRRALSESRQSSTLPTSNITTTPTPSPTQYRVFSGGRNDMDSTSSIDVLIAALFLIAAGWLVLAIIYSVLIICVVRMRARGELDVYDEHFGRLYFCTWGENRGCYLPLGCLLRRHILALHRAHEQSRNVRIMSRTERRHAMEQLLGRAAVADSAAEGQDCFAKEALSEENRNDADTLSNNEDRHGDLESCEGQEPLCSICLMEYGTWWSVSSQDTSAASDSNFRFVRTSVLTYASLIRGT